MLLFDLYMQEKDSLLKEMNQKSTIDGLIKVINQYLEKITDLNGEYISDLTPPQARMALSIIGNHKEHFRRLLDQVEQVPDTSTQVKNSTGVPDYNTLAGIGVSTVIAALLTNPLIAIPLASLAGFITATALIAKKKSGSSSLHPEKDVSTNQNPKLHLDYNEFLSNLENLFRTVDEVIIEHERLTEAARPKTITPKLEDHERFLEFIQDFLGWYQRKKDEIPENLSNILGMRFEKQLPNLLSEQGIKICYFNPENEVRDLELFDFESEVGEPRLIKPMIDRPALIKGENVLLKGRIIEPTSDKLN